MKKQIIVAAGLAVLSTSAFATKARMEALGQGTGGSFYLEDTRRIFVNPAHLNNLKNYIVTEWGDDNSDGTDAEAAPDAEGGFFREMGNFAYGLYLGNDSNAQNELRTTAFTGYAGTGTFGEAGLKNHDNALDLFFAGDMGVQWGARIHYAQSKDEQTGLTTATNNFERKNSAFGLGFGITMGDLDAYANLDISDKSEGSTASSKDKFEADLGLNLGFAYSFGGMTAFADYSKMGAEFTDFATSTSTTSLKDTTEMATFTVGAAQVHEVSSTAIVVFDARYSASSAEDVDQTSLTVNSTKEVKIKTLSVRAAFETDATSWLTLRGSISHSLPFLSKRDTKTVTTGATGLGETRETLANSTTVNAGATLNFGKLKVDGRIGSTAVSRAGTLGDNGVLTLDNLMTRVGVHYWF